MPDRASREVPTIKRKALRINLDQSIYGTFAEIGAGQEVARHFFRVGGASGTIAKSMSAYDMAFSDQIYGAEPSGRYVSRSRLVKMLDHEMDLLTERLNDEAYAGRRFFVLADTVTTLNYTKSNDPHGWLGVRFQRTPDGPFNDVMLHVRLHDNNTQLQQRVVGELGVNLLFACFNHADNTDWLVDSLVDDLSSDDLEIDMISIEGPDFAEVDNRLLSLLLVKKGYTDATIFGPNGEVYQPKDLLYKKDVLVLRGRFHPVTKVNWDMLGRAYDMFVQEPDVKADNVISLAEMTLDLLADEEGEADMRKDFLDRADILCALRQYVMVTNYTEHHKLAAYLDRCRVGRKGLVIGIMNLMNIYGDGCSVDEAHRVLSYFGRLFDLGVRFYAYPYQPDADGPVHTSTDLAVGDCLQPLHDYLVRNRCIVDIEDYDPSILQIFSDDVIASIRAGRDDWEDKVPDHVAELIKRNCLFEYPCAWVPPEKDFSVRTSS